MTFRIKTLLVMLVALLLAVPTGAMAKGKPSWAGQGNGGGGHGKPSWAGHGKADKGKGHGKAAHEKKAKKDKQHGNFGAASQEDENDPDGLSLEDLEALEAIHAPGQYCHALESFQGSVAGLWGGDSFDEHFGTNDNLANSFGKCASWRAQGGSLEEDAAEEEEPAEESCEPAEEEEAPATAVSEEEGSEEGTEEGSEEGTEEGSEESTEDECEAEEPAEDEEQAEEELTPEQLEALEALEAISSPGQYCHMLEALQGDFAGLMSDQSFDEHFGTNASNSHGKCASWRAHGGTLGEEQAEDEAGGEADDPADEEPAEGESEEDAEDGDSEDGEPAEAQRLSFTFRFRFDFGFLTF
jgi:hypothetical protein